MCPRDENEANSDPKHGFCPCGRSQQSSSSSSPGIRSRMFGIGMKGGEAARVTDVSKFRNWSWWIYLTPSFQSTVFHRPGLHLSVLGYLIVANLVFWNKHYAPQYEIYDVDDFAGTTLDNLALRLVVFVLSSYMFQVVSAYWTGTKHKASRMLRGMARSVDAISTILDYSNPRSEKVLNEIRDAFVLVGKYSLCISARHTKHALSMDELAHLFQGVRYNSDLLLKKIHCKQATNVLRQAVLQTVQRERLKDDGCMRLMSNESFDRFQTHLFELTDGGRKVMSSTTSSKLPFDLYQLVTWGTKMMLFFYVTGVYSTVSRELVSSGSAVPFSCLGGTVMPDEGETYCPTRFYVILNLFYASVLYFILGCLEIYHSVTKIWENGLVLRNYMTVVDLLCEPLVASPCTRPPDLSYYRVN